MMGQQDGQYTNLQEHCIGICALQYIKPSMCNTSTKKLVIHKEFEHSLMATVRNTCDEKDLVTWSSGSSVLQDFEYNRGQIKLLGILCKMLCTLTLQALNQSPKPVSLYTSQLHSGACRTGIQFAVPWTVSGRKLQAKPQFL